MPWRLVWMHKDELPLVEEVRRQLGRRKRHDALRAIVDVGLQRLDDERVLFRLPERVVFQAHRNVRIPAETAGSSRGAQSVESAG